MKLNMAYLKKADPVTRFLVGASALGILVSLFVFTRSLGLSEAKATGPAIASIVMFEKDTRLKRADDIHWVPVGQKAACFTRDMVFTGPDSHATLVFKDGGEVRLLPNSLILIDEGRVALNTGTIEVDLTKGKLAVESFGEKIVVTEKVKFKIENSDLAKKIIFAKGDDVTSIKSNKRLSRMLDPRSIVLEAPVNGIKWPLLGKINFSWKGTSKDKDSTYIFELSEQSDFQNIHVSKNSFRPYLSLPASDLSARTWYWRVLGTKGEKSDSGYFTLTDNYAIQLSLPKSGATYPLKDSSERGLDFEWSNPLETNQRLQIARDEEFQDTVYDKVEARPIASIRIDQEGTYHWRVGYQLAGWPEIWSPIAKFKVTPDRVLVPLSFLGLDEVMDFSLRSEYVVSISDMNPCQTYEYVLYRNDRVVSRTKTSKRSLKLRNLRDGEYQIQVEGVLEDLQRVKSELKNFKVQNSQPIGPPKIKNQKKTKLFVRVLKSLMDLVIPSAAADVESVTLEWEPTKGTGYEIEIVDAKDMKPLVTTKVFQTSYVFTVPALGEYRWRIRTMNGQLPGAFSEYHDLDVRDRVSVITNPLMISPADGTVVETEGVPVELRWERVPGIDDYFVEIFTAEKGKPLATVKAKGDSFKLKFKQNPAKVYWRVFAKSKHGNITPNRQRYVITYKNGKTPMTPPPVDKSESKLQLWGGMARTSFDLLAKAEGEEDLKASEDLSGTAFLASFDHVFAGDRKRHALTVTAGMNSLTGKATQVSTTLVGAEYGKVGAAQSAVDHQFYVGFQYRSGTFKVDEDSEGSFKVNFASGRYRFVNQITKNYRLSLQGMILLPMNKDFGQPSFSLRPEISRLLSSALEAKVFLQYDSVSVNGSKDNEDFFTGSKLQMTDMTVGLGLGYSF